MPLGDLLILGDADAAERGERYGYDQRERGLAERQGDPRGGEADHGHEPAEDGVPSGDERDRRAGEVALGVGFLDEAGQRADVADARRHHHQRADDEDAAADGDERGGQSSLPAGDDGEADAHQAGHRAVDARPGAAEHAAGHHRGGDDREGHGDRDARYGLLGGQLRRPLQPRCRGRLRRDPRLGSAGRGRRLRVLSVRTRG